MILSKNVALGVSNTTVPMYKIQELLATTEAEVQLESLSVMEEDRKLSSCESGI